MVSWMTTGAAAETQRRHIAGLVAAGLWTGPQPSPEVLRLAAELAEAAEEQERASDEAWAECKAATPGFFEVIE